MNLEERDIADTLDALSWGVFFIWLGIVWLAEVPSGWAFLVIGLTTPGGQAAGHGFHLGLEGFWMVVGMFPATGVAMGAGRADSGRPGGDPVRIRAAGPEAATCSRRAT